MLKSIFKFILSAYILMKTMMGRIIRKKHKIFNSVIVFNAINMMNNLFNSKISAQMFFHNYSVFKDIIRNIFIWMFMTFNKNVSFVLFFSTFPLWISPFFFRNSKIEFVLFRKLFPFSGVGEIFSPLLTKWRSFSANMSKRYLDLLFFRHFCSFGWHKTILSFFLIMSFNIIQCQYSFSEWNKDIPLSGDNLTSFPVDNQTNLDALDLVLSNYRKGMTLTYSSANTLVATAGEIVCSNSLGTVRKLRSNPSSSNITFSDIDTGAEASSTTYYVYANCDASATTATFKISLSSTDPSGVTSYERLGSIYNDASSNITRVNNDNVTNEIGEKESKTDGVTYQATTDGYFVGLIDAGGSTGSYGDIIGYTDNASTPTTVMGYASGWRVDSTFSASTGNRKNSFMFPVKAGDYYKGSSSTTGSVTVTFYFVPKS